MALLSQEPGSRSYSHCQTALMGDPEKVQQEHPFIHLEFIMTFRFAGYTDGQFS